MNCPSVFSINATYSCISEFRSTKEGNVCYKYSSVVCFHKGSCVTSFLTSFLPLSASRTSLVITLPRQRYLQTTATPKSSLSLTRLTSGEKALIHRVVAAKNNGARVGKRRQSTSLQRIVAQGMDPFSSRPAVPVEMRAKQTAGRHRSNGSSMLTRCADPSSTEDLEGHWCPSISVSATFRRRFHDLTVIKPIDDRNVFRNCRHSGAIA